MSVSYIHTISGRIRIKIGKVRGAEDAARRLEEQLSVHTGVHVVQANPVTGNVLIEYDPEQAREREILKALRRLGWLTRGHIDRSDLGSSNPSEFATICAEKALTVGLEAFLLRLLKLA